jgi:hypothetical protein
VLRVVGGVRVVFPVVPHPFSSSHCFIPSPIASRAAFFSFLRLYADTHRPQRACSSLAASFPFLIASRSLFHTPLPSFLLLFPRRII